MSSGYTLQLQCEWLKTDPATAPEPRSAHCCVVGPDECLWLTAGDSGQAGRRLNDVWQLDTRIGSTWRQRRVVSLEGQQAHNDLCIARSNAAVAAVQGWLLVFGGWSSTGLAPLGHLQAYNFVSNTWHTPVAAGPAPTPRGQPAAAANSAGTAVYLFGGWDGSHRYNDLHRLLTHSSDPDSWAWELLTPRPAPPKGARAGITFQQQQQQQREAQHMEQQSVTGQHDKQQPAEEHQQLLLPCARADHVMVCWRYCDDGLWKELLVVFGGSCADGLLNDTWLFDINTSSWTQAFYGGAAPCPRSSCAAAISGDVLLLHGGQTPVGVLQDMYLLNLSTLTWLQVDLGPVLQPLCRHSMNLVNDTAIIFGGYDGSSASSRLLRINLHPVMQLQRSSLQELITCMACCGSGSSGYGAGKATVSTGGDQQQPAAADSSCCTLEVADSDDSQADKLKAVGVVPRTSLLQVPRVVKVLSKKAAPPPLQLSDLPNAEEVAAMPQWKQVRQLHQAALAAGCDQYIDPKTGYTVFTAKYLQQRQCCGNKCRHCPHGWVNVAKQRLQPAAAAAPAAVGLPDW